MEYYPPYQQPIIINTGASTQQKQGTLLGILILGGVVWWFFSSKEDTPDSKRGNLSFAVFNKNPGNVKKGSFQYPAEITPVGNEYRKYANWEDGYAGLIIHLRRYAAGFIEGVQRDSIRKIIPTYAPPRENKTEEYIKFLCKETGFSENDKLNFYTRSTCLKMCKAIAKMEDGNSPRDDATIIAGFNKAANYSITK